MWRSQTLLSRKFDSHKDAKSLRNSITFSRKRHKETSIRCGKLGGTSERLKESGQERVEMPPRVNRCSSAQRWPSRERSKCCVFGLVRVACHSSVALDLLLRLDTCGVWNRYYPPALESQSLFMSESFLLICHGSSLRQEGPFPRRERVTPLRVCLL